MVLNWLNRPVQYICLLIIQQWPLIILLMISRNLLKSGFAETKYRVVFLRHGESEWNKENRFSGWTDVFLSAQGIREAQEAGTTLKQNGFRFDICYTSVLTRAIQTFNYLADDLNCHYIPVHKNWRLNQRHYGALQGLNKAETAEKHGEDKVKIWRRSFDVPPPFLEQNDSRHPIHDIRYKNVDPKDLPAGQSLKMCIDRVMPYWNSTIKDSIKQGKNVLVVAHGNSLRSIIKELNNMPNDEIMELNVPTAIPLVYQLDADFKPVKKFYLADQKDLEKKINDVKNQGKKKDE